MALPSDPRDTTAPDLPDALPAGDVEAFHRAVDAYVDPLRRFVYTYVGSWETAEELVNDAFLRLWRRLRMGEAVRDLKAYLYTTSRNGAISYLRHQAVEARHLREYLQPHLDAGGAVLLPEAEHDVMARDLAAAIQRAVDTLPSRQRAVLLLRWQREATREEISDTLGIAPKTVAEHLRRAMDQLRSILPDLLAE